MGFLRPHNLFWALSLAVLLAIYLRSRARRILDVSSLILFDQLLAPAARVRRLKLDPLFWIEIAILAASALALAGLFIRTAPTASEGRTRALVFDLAAGMGARDGVQSRLDLARQEAFAIIDSAASRDRFSVIGYAQEAQMFVPDSADLVSLHAAIEAMQSNAVPAHSAALAAALMRAQASGEIELFADRPPSASVLVDAGITSHFHFHQAGAAVGNLAIISLDPGVPRNSPGRVALRNFSSHDSECEISVECAGRPALDRTIFLAPNEQVVVPFGPLPTGGLVHAEILTPDALAADNQRFALAPSDQPAHVLVLSHQAAVRDDIARVLLAVNNNFIVTTQDPINESPEKEDSGNGDKKPRASKTFASGLGGNQTSYALAVMHDCYLPRVKADSLLLIYPPDLLALNLAPRSFTGPMGGKGVLGSLGTVKSAELTWLAGAESDSTPTLLGATRILSVPQWMSVSAWGAASGKPEPIALAVVGELPSLRVGVLGFDIKDHLLLDPDRLNALVAAVDIARALTIPPELRIVSTGSFVSIPAPADAKLIAPDGAVLPISRDRWGRLLMRPMEAGHYRVESASRDFDIYANYYDASESNLRPSALAPAAPKAPVLRVTMTMASEARPLTRFLIAFALAALLLESALLVRHVRRELRHV